MLQESELELSQEDYSPVALRSNFQSLGLSGVNRLYTDDSFGGMRNLELGVAGEAWHSQPLGAGGAVSPSISIGLRGDGRNDKASEFHKMQIYKASGP